MFSWTEDILNQAKAQVKQMAEEVAGTPSNTKNQHKCDVNGVSNTVKQSRLYHPFELPIHYLENSEVHPLSSVVNQDLELVVSKGEKSMYQHLFQPTHEFGNAMIQEWSKSYSTNVEFLKETQQVVHDCSKMPNPTIKHDALMEIWKETKGESSEYFLEKYCYVEWDVLEPLNRSPAFLQTMTFINISSPVISLLVPILFFIFPFLILKMRGIPITFSVYLEVLQDIAKHHFIGKAISNITSISLDKLIYLVLMTGLYFYQIYQNVLQCKRFYENIHKINRYLFEIREYLGQSIQNMDTFVTLHGSKTTYSSFCGVVQEHRRVLAKFRKELEEVNPIQVFAFNLGKIGYLLKCYYELHTNTEYEKSIRYSFGFEGYLDNLRGVSKHLHNGTMHFANYDRSMTSVFKDGYYPPYHDKPHVKNTCSMKRKMIITGPNASGKTTLLKTMTINIIFSQQLGAGFFKSCVLNPYTHIHSYLNIPDTSERDSLFQAESRRCKEIIDVVSKTQKETTPNTVQTRHFCIFDELYSGTNPLEATKSAYAFLKYLSNYDNVDFVLTTHYVSVCKRLKKYKQIKNYKMDVLPHATDENSCEYTYKIKSGISNVQGAFQILKDMNYPKEILDSMREDTWKKRKSEN